MSLHFLTRKVHVCALILLQMWGAEAAVVHSGTGRSPLAFTMEKGLHPRQLAVTERCFQSFPDIA